MNAVPSNVVAESSLMGRTPVASDVAHAMRSDAERRDTKEAAIHRQQGMSEPPISAGHEDDRWRYKDLADPDTQKYVQDGKVNGFAIDSEAAQRIVKNINTAADVKINRYMELAAYSRWGAIGAMASAFAALASVMNIFGAAGAATGMAAAGFPALVLFGAGAIVLGGATLYMSEQAKRLQSSRWMDIQEFLQERNAVKIGQQVAKAVTQTPERADGKSWGDVVKISQEQAQQVNQGRA